MSIFGGYDVRGIYGDSITEETARELGLAFAKFLGNKGKVVIHHDPRKSSPSLSKALAGGLLSGGLGVIDIGMQPTPVGYFAGVHFNAEATVSITASHNPAQYAGFKFCKNNLPLTLSEQHELEEIYNSKDFVEAEEAGGFSEGDVSEAYVDYVFGAVGALPRPLKVVVDSGNGACGPTAVALLKRLGCVLVDLYTEPDGAFPNHLPDPHNKSTLAELQKRIPEEKADAGVAFDGDGDRVYFMDEKGTVLMPDRVAVLFVREALKKKPGAVIPVELRCSMVLLEEIKKLGGKVLMIRAGRVSVRNSIHENNSPFSTESTGHVCFGENHGFDDGFFAACKFISLLSESGVSASALMSSVKKYFTSVEYRLTVPAERKLEIVCGVKKTLSADFKVNELDGVRISSPDYWGLLRVSQTEPKITLRFEGKTRGHLELVYGVFKDALAKQKVELPPLQE